MGVENRAGQLIKGRYKLKGCIGGGAYGSVYKGDDLSNGTPVAIKFLVGRSPDAPERFVREARIHEALRECPYILRLLDYDLDHAPPFLVTTLCEHGSLRSWVTARRGWRDVAGALLHVVRGLDAIHRAGGFHRDIKPDNLLVARHPTAAGKVIIQVGDLGLARLPETASPLTRHPGGTELYMAPEILRGGGFDQRADIFSLGVVAAELATGHPSAIGLGPAMLPTALRSCVRNMLLHAPAARPTLQQIAGTLTSLLSEPNVAAEAEPSSGMGPLVFGGLLAGAAMLAFGALSSGDEGASPPRKRRKGARSQLK